MSLASPDASVEEDTSWRQALSRHARPDIRRSVLGLATSVVPFFALWALMYLALQVSYVLVLVLALPAAGFMVRTYIVFHDCAHGSFLPGRRANGYVGAVLGLIVFTPFARWRHDHTIHHATAGDLDRRGTGDHPILTVAEYQARSRLGRAAYQVVRNPFMMFGLGPLLILLLLPRFASRAAPARIKRSVWMTNVMLAAVVGSICLLLGWREFLLVQMPLIALAGGVGIWLFYVQHQFDDTYWQRNGRWRYTDAALRGSSYLRLPRLLQFFTGNIGLHHVHHLNAKIPNYELQRAHDGNPVFDGVPRVSLWEGLRAVRLKLWDEEAGRLVTWAESRRPPSRDASAIGAGVVFDLGPRLP